MVNWFDTDGEPVLNVNISSTPDLTLMDAVANWFDSTTAPTSVKVSVKAK